MKYKQSGGSTSCQHHDIYLVAAVQEIVVVYCLVLLPYIMAGKGTKQRSGMRLRLNHPHTPTNTNHTSWGCREDPETPDISSPSSSLSFIERNFYFVHEYACNCWCWASLCQLLGSSHLFQIWRMNAAQNNGWVAIQSYLHFCYKLSMPTSQLSLYLRPTFKRYTCRHIKY